ncbi:hypothetical protein BDN67DRAFT_970298, partial [Paxillus ammoniavirescens]
APNTTLSHCHLTSTHLRSRFHCSPELESPSILRSPRLLSSQSSSAKPCLGSIAASAATIRSRMLPGPAGPD